MQRLACRTTYQVISQELHYEGGVLIALFTQGVELYRKLQQLHLGRA